jgi:hypothetical protein
MVHSRKESDLSEAAREVRTEMSNRTLVREPRLARFAAPQVAAPDHAMPDYVEHLNGATEIGKLSAEAVVREYEAAVKEIESLGGGLIERAKQCEEMTRNALAVTAELNEVAARYRAEAKRIFEQIESCSMVVAEARGICGDLKDKIAAPLAVKK